MDKVNSIKQAFTAGSGINSTALIAVLMVAIFGVVFVMALSVIFKRLNQFRKDENADEVIKTTMIVFLTIIVVIIVTHFVVI